MNVTYPPTTVFYRVVGPGRTWYDVLTGLGAFYGRAAGNRYSGHLQQAVYVSIEPLVALTEAAYYEGRRWQSTVGQTTLPAQPGLVPFRTQPGKGPRLWSFTLHRPPLIVDVTDPGAFHTFAHSPFILFNPSNDHYLPTQELMARVHAHNPPVGGARFMGVQAPSVRAPRPAGGGQPMQQVFLLGPRQARLQGASVASWNLDIEFLDLETQGPVTAGTSVVDWGRPRVMLRPRGGAGSLPGSPCRPAGIAANVWERLEVRWV
jgi:hypothetical protein